MFSEGSLSLCLFAASLNDSEDSADQILLNLLTPVIKAWPSEFTLEANKWAIQVLGGYGYTEDFSLEQIYRDNRLNMIHEGTNGVQALTLLGRNVTLNSGAGMKDLLRRMRDCAARAGDEGKVVSQAVDTLEETTGILVGEMMQNNTSVAMANSHDYANMFGHVVVGWMWLEQLIVAQKALTEKSNALSYDEKNFYSGKVIAAQYFFQHELVKVETQAKVLNSLDTKVLQMENEFF